MKKLTPLIIAAALAFTACGSDDDVPQDNPNVVSPEDGTSYELYNRELSDGTRCVVVISNGFEERGAGVSCDWD